MILLCNHKRTEFGKPHAQRFLACNNLGADHIENPSPLTMTFVAVFIYGAMGTVYQALTIEDMAVSSAGLRPKSDCSGKAQK
jgi:hypothetical protein